MYSRKMKIKKDTIVYPSTMGHYNFHYPKLDEEYVLTMDIEVSHLHWAESEGLFPVKIISPVNYLPYKVLWVSVPR
tara:strand:+ start:6588 stop:6815 length:228 start_codon:yes stop_codon:yes gene_type:complete